MFESLFLSRRDLQRRQNLQKYKSKFDISKFIKEYYIDDDGYAYISANVDDIDDIISPYSVKGYDWINPDFADYVEESFYFIPIEEKVKLEICGGNFSDKQKARIEKVISSYYSLKLGDKELDLNQNRNRVISFIGIGLLILGLYFIFSLFAGETVAAEVIPIFFWTFLEGGMELVIYDRNDIMEAKMDAAQLANMKITFLDEEEED